MGPLKLLIAGNCPLHYIIGPAYHNPKFWFLVRCSLLQYSIMHSSENELLRSHNRDSSFSDLCAILRMGVFFEQKVSIGSTALTSATARLGP